MDLSNVLCEEHGSSYQQEIIVDARIQKIGHDLKSKHNFKQPSLYKRLVQAISRENIVLFGIITGEEAVNSNQCYGNVNIPIIDRNQIRNNIIKTLSEKDRKKIGYIHISTLQLILKSTFALGIKSEIELELSDDRFIDRRNSIIAKGKGDLAQGKIKFNVNYQVGMSLSDDLLERSMTLRYKLLGSPLMKDGNHPFSVTYQVNYALTNSHHSLSFKPGDKIEVDQLFEPIVQLSIPRTMRFTPSSSSSRIRNDSFDHRGKSSQRFITEDKYSSNSPSKIDSLLDNPKLTNNQLVPNSLAEKVERITQELGIN